MKLFIVVIVAFMLAACQPSPEAISAAIAETQAALPTATPEPTATRIPLSQLDIESLLIQDGDFPDSIKPGQIGDVLPKEFPTIIKPDVIVSQKFMDSNYDGYGIVVLLYENKSTVKDVYTDIAYWIKNRSGVMITMSENYGAGEFGMFESFSGTMGIGNMWLTFGRCNAVVFINGYGPSARGDTFPVYARRLDKRLREVVCR